MFVALFTKGSLSHGSSVGSSSLCLCYEIWCNNKVDGSALSFTEEARNDHELPVHFLVLHTPPPLVNGGGGRGGREARVLPLSGCLLVEAGLESTEYLLSRKMNQHEPLNLQFVPISSRDQ